MGLDGMAAISGGGGAVSTAGGGAVSDGATSRRRGVAEIGVVEDGNRLFHEFFLGENERVFLGGNAFFLLARRQAIASERNPILFCPFEKVFEFFLGLGDFFLVGIFARIVVAAPARLALRGGRERQRRDRKKDRKIERKKE